MRAFAPKCGMAYHHGDLRRALLDATIEIVDERGLAGVNIAEAARRAGVSSGAPYKHFKDKDDLLFALADYSEALLLEEIRKETAGVDDPQEIFRLTGICYARWAGEHPGLFLASMDPRFIRFDREHEDTQWWRALASKIKSGERLEPSDPMFQQLAGRALIVGLATLFANGVFDALGVKSDQAERLARVLTGESTP